MSQLTNLSFAIKNFDVEKFWEESEQYAKVELTYDDSEFDYPCTLDWSEAPLREEKVPGKRGARPFKSSLATKGVYGWFIEEGNFYIGKTDSVTGSINHRQMSHFRSLVNPYNQTESSGRKIREYMEENGLTSLKITIKYVDLTPYSDIPGLPALIEELSIQKFKPLINKETVGYGNR